MLREQKGCKYKFELKKFCGVERLLVILMMLFIHIFENISFSGVDVNLPFMSNDEFLPDNYKLKREYRRIIDVYERDGRNC